MYDFEWYQRAVCEDFTAIAGLEPGPALHPVGTVADATEMLQYSPIRQAALVVAMARKLRDENKLTAEQVAWIPTAESQLESMRNRIGHQEQADSVWSQVGNISRP